MNNGYYKITAKTLSGYDVVVGGGGFAGVAAAIRAAENGAKTLLIESGGELGGDITKGIVPQLLDPLGKGGLMRDIYAYLNTDGHTSARRGERWDKDGKKIPGTVVDLEYVKYYLAKICLDLGVDVIYHSILCGAETSDGIITEVIAATEAGNYIIPAKIFIDATGNGSLAAMAGCEYEFGHPESKAPQPAGSAMLIKGLDSSVSSTDSNAAKQLLKEKLESSGIPVSAEGIALVRYVLDDVWLLYLNNQYNVPADDILLLSEATRDAKIECVEVFDRMKTIEGFENAELLATSSHIGIREGRRILGRYKLTFEDITSGTRFDDGVCLARFSIDVHSISPDDKLDHTSGKRVKPYNIPYRALLPIGCDNLLTAGRCISGDFYAHASYRVIGNVIPMGEAAGYAAALCASSGILPGDVDGTKVSAYMQSLGYSM